MDATFFTSPDDFRNWLEENHHQAKELLVGFYKTKTKKPSITYQQALDEVLCYGWIDGVRKSRDDESYTIRFTPRRVGSIWSQVNIKRVGELTDMGRMQPPGLK